jgi:hypothetical protein
LLDTAVEDEAFPQTVEVTGRKLPLMECGYVLFAFELLCWPVLAELDGIKYRV